MPPSLASPPASPPSPGLSPAVAGRLREIVGPRGFLDDPARLLVYESDGLTQYRVSPSAVVLPASAEELSRALAVLHEAGVPVVPRGAGTGLSGGALAIRGGVIVGTSRMTRILEVDPVNRIARVEPGVVNARLTEATLPHGLVYAPDPSSQSACTLGGNVAENSGGPHCLKHGVTSRYVHALRVALPDGRIVRLGGSEAFGELDLVGLFTGSEGCFGIAVEIEVGLVPAPGSVRTLLALFDSVADAGTAVTRLMAEGLLPAALEIVDQETIRAVEASVFAAGFPVDAGAALVVEFDGLEAGLDLDAEAARMACLEAGATQVRVASEEAERMALWRGRKKAFGAMGRIAPDLLVQDATVPRSRLPQVLARITSIGKRYDLVVANVFHAGDGNLHPNLLFDRRDPDQVARVEAASREIMAACIEAGGTITGEHGVGIDKRDYLPLVCPPPVLRTLGEVRRVFDPEGRMNPGKVLPDGWGPPAPPPLEPWPPLPEELPAPAEPGPREDPAPAGEATGGSPRRDPSGGGRHAAGSTPHPDLPEGVLEYEPADLVIRVRGELSLDALQAVTRARGQWFPADPPSGKECTVAELLLAGLDGPLAGGYGRIRDHLLGVTLRTRRGERLSLGGRVVKNVAGFDLVRLVVGSRGRLGEVEDATLRLFPLPRVDRTLRLACDLERGLQVARTIRDTGFPVGALAWFGPGDGGEGELAVRLLGREEEVASMASALAPLLGQEGGPGRGAGAEEDQGLGVPHSESGAAWWKRQAEAFAPEAEGPPVLALRAPFRKLGQVARSLGEAGAEALALHGLSGGPGEVVLARGMGSASTDLPMAWNDPGEEAGDQERARLLQGVLAVFRGREEGA